MVNLSVGVFFIMVMRIIFFKIFIFLVKVIRTIIFFLIVAMRTRIFVCIMVMRMIYFCV